MGFPFIPFGGITVWLESGAGGSQIISPVRSYLLPSTGGEKRGNITLRSRTMSQKNVFTWSQRAADLNAKWTQSRQTTFYPRARLLLSDLRPVKILSLLRILPDPIDLLRRSSWQRTDEPGAGWRRDGGGDKHARPSISPRTHTERLVITKSKWLVFFMYQHVKDTAPFRVEGRDQQSSGGRTNILKNAAGETLCGIN